MEEHIRSLCQQHPIGAILCEPVQGRAGNRIPPASFLPRLRQLADEAGALLIADEIFTGFGRTGRWFACEHSRTVPDLLCLGKALTGGFPLSACVGRSDLMDRAWPETRGEALHTSTFLGHPVGCAMALAQIREVDRLIGPALEETGAWLLQRLQKISVTGLALEARGLGLMAAIEIREPAATAPQIAWRAVTEMLREGFLILPEGERGSVLALIPPLTISRPQLKRAAAALQRCLQVAADPQEQAQ